MAYSISFIGTYDGAMTALLDSPLLDIAQKNTPGIPAERILSNERPLATSPVFVVNDINNGTQVTLLPTGLAASVVIGLTASIDFNQTIEANCPPQLPVPNQQLYPRRV